MTSLRSLISYGFIRPASNRLRLHTGSPSAAESLTVASALAVLAIVASVISAHGPQHADALMDAEIAICPLQGYGMTTFAHPHTTPGISSVPLVPLYVLGLAAWLAVFGISALAVMSFNAWIIALSLMLFWFALRRASMFHNRMLLGSLPIAAMCAIPVAKLYFINRYDSLGMLGLALAGVCLSLPNRAARTAGLASAGVIVGLGGGLHVSIASVIIAAISLLIYGWSCLPAVITFAGSVCAAMGALLGGHYMVDSLATLSRAISISGVHQNRSLSSHMMAAVRGGYQTAVLDDDLVLLVIAAVGSLVTLRLSDSRSKRRLSCGCFAAGIVIPVVLSTAGRYSNTYAWLASIPLLTSATLGIDELLRARRRTFAGLMTSGVCGIALLGLPLRAVYALIEWDARDLNKVERRLENLLRPDDTVYATSSGYYPVKRRTPPGFLLSAFHSMTAEQRASVTIMIIDGMENGVFMFQPTFEEARDSFGGQWVEVERIVIPRGHLRSRLPPKALSDVSFNIGVYRRLDVPATTR